MALTRIKSQSILDREVREHDLADGAISFNKLLLADIGAPGDVLTVDGFGNLLFAPATGTPRTLNSLDDVSVGGALNDQVLAYNSTTALWRPVAIPGLSDSSNTYIVVNIPARNALTPNEGDQVFVRAGASGEWEMYLYDSGFPGGPWVLLATADSARTDANTIQYTISVGGPASPITIGNVSQGSRVTIVTVDIELGSEFDGPGIVFSVGDAGDTARLIDIRYIDLETEGSYVCQPDYVYPNATDTDILLTYDFGGASTGTARIVVTHV